MSLQKYWQKRDFTKTPEPRGTALKTGGNLSFFIQKHHARHLHYDFRLELEGTLKSWAIPKGPSLDPADKRLAVHVEDHPIAYGSFEGEIPQYSYGAGSVLVWDQGVWLPDGDALDGLKKGRLKFQLQGEKLSGGWTLVRMGAAKSDKETWLLIKERDAYAKSGTEADITLLQPDSVLSDKGRKSSTVKITKPATAPDLKKSLGRPPVRRRKFDATDATAKADMPAFIRPQLATLTDRPPAGDEWLSEIKFDGYRALCRIEHGNASLFSRNGNDWTKKWRDVANAAARLPAKQAWLDGEVAALAEDGSISFQLLQNMAQTDSPARLVYYVFDLLYLDGHDLREAPLIERKQLLETLMGKTDQEGILLFSDHIQGNAADAFSHACMHGLEGIIAKRADAPYASERSRSWVKVKCKLRQEFVVGGYTDPAGTREKFGALLIGVYDDQRKLQYAGRIGTGFNVSMLKTIAKEFVKLESRTSPFERPPTGRDAVGVHWLKPKLIAEANFSQWTNSNIIRHASFVGLRQDKNATDIHREMPVPAQSISSTSSKTNPTTEKSNREIKTSLKNQSRNTASSVAGVRLTHPSRIIFSDGGISKLGLAQYYEEIEEWIMPHLAQRPLSLVRCPNGAEHECFFQKHANQSIGDDVQRIEVPSGKTTATYMMANSTPALISLVQMGMLELHTWGAHKGQLEKPDRIIFDLDPAPDLPWLKVIEAAQLVKSLMDEIGLASFVKTTGGKGLHVAIPLKAERSWEEIKVFSRSVAEHLERLLPDRFTSKMSKSKRHEKIFIDYLRNAAGATAVAAYSSRARPNATVSTPIGWDELHEDLRSDSFTVLNIRDRLKKLKHDPWREYFLLKQRISEKMIRAFI